MHSWRGTRRSRFLSVALAIAAFVALALAVGFAKATPSAQSGYQNSGPTTVKITQNAQFISSFQINVVLTISCPAGSGYFTSVDVQQPQGGFTTHGSGQTSGQCTGRQQKVAVSVYTFDGSWQLGNAVASATSCCGGDTKQIHIVA
jgi:hypothetical protein